MIIYGTAVLAACHLLGLYLGDLLGAIIGVKSNVGGVGIAMILLISSKHFLRKHNLMPKETEMGVTFWGAMYIPVVIAMAATQNVKAAVSGGPVAVIAALLTVVFCGLVISGINRMSGNEHEALKPETQGT